MGFPDGLMKNSPAMQETQVPSLDQEDPLEKEMAARSSILAWRIPWTEDPGGYSPWGPEEWGVTEVTQHSTAHAMFTEKNSKFSTTSKQF